MISLPTPRKKIPVNVLVIPFALSSILLALPHRRHGRPTFRLVVSPSRPILSAWNFCCLYTALTASLWRHPPFLPPFPCNVARSSPCSSYSAFMRSPPPLLNFTSLAYPPLLSPSHFPLRRFLRTSVNGYPTHGPPLFSLRRHFPARNLFRWCTMVPQSVFVF